MVKAALQNMVNEKLPAARRRQGALHPPPVLRSPPGARCDQVKKLERVLTAKPDPLLREAL
jgi:hypothetical protein